MRTSQRTQLIFVLLLLVFRGSPTPLLGQAATAAGQNAPLNGVIDVSLNKTEVRVGETALITFRITNRGSGPFYIPKTIEESDNYGGFQAVVTGPPGGKWSSRVQVGERWRYVDVVKEVEESWILLWPGDFYGGTRPLATVPMSPGTYTVVGRRNPPRVTDELREQLHTALKFPVLLDSVDSKPIYLKVVK
jgi:hypothetical protein